MCGRCWVRCLITRDDTEERRTTPPESETQNEGGKRLLLHLPQHATDEKAHLKRMHTMNGTPLHGTTHQRELFSFTQKGVA